MAMEATTGRLTAHSPLAAQAAAGGAIAFHLTASIPTGMRLRLRVELEGRGHTVSYNAGEVARAGPRGVFVVHRDEDVAAAVRGQAPLVPEERLAHGAHMASLRQVQLLLRHHHDAGATSPPPTAAVAWAPRSGDERGAGDDSSGSSSSSSSSGGEVGVVRDRWNTVYCDDCDVVEGVTWGLRAEKGRVRWCADCAARSHPGARQILGRPPSPPRPEGPVRLLQRRLGWATDSGAVGGGAPPVITPQGRAVTTPFASVSSLSSASPLSPRAAASTRPMQRGRASTQSLRAAPAPAPAPAHPAKKPVSSAAAAPPQKDAAAAAAAGAAGAAGALRQELASRAATRDRQQRFIAAAHAAIETAVAEEAPSGGGGVGPGRGRPPEPLRALLGMLKDWPEVCAYE
jgi:hypothetical protein